MTRALISWVIDYGAYIIYTKAGNLEQNKKIRRIESAALRAAMGYRMSTPIAVMYADTGFVGHHLRAKQAAIRYWLKEMEKSESNQTSENSFNWKEKILNKRKNLDKIYIDKESGKKFETGAIPLNTINQFLMDKHNVKEEDTIICYTDGSKQENKTSNGIGIIFNLPQGKTIETGYSIHKEATIYITEAIVLIGLESVIEKLDTTDKRCNNAWILTIYKALINLKNREKIVLVWVPGHQGIPGNEKADILAKECTNHGKIYQS
ncbi:uncharacterized protein LOC128895830 [Hylaeus anthracinus]|uniref:uncharacterized protein LOC128895830 n=1 Tax=Hylaeus anthracinus TaxID=313031 RepID=UPI0023BA3A6C|nr:uncharacterized protein LOC128895830 [Hylaeus anthracinus]